MLGKRLAELRKARKQTQASISKLLGIHRGTYANYEAQKREPDNETLQKLADFFGVSIDYLLGRTDDPKAPYDYRKDPEISDEAKKILDKVATLTPEQQRLFFEQMKVTIAGYEAQNRSSNNG